MNDDDFVEMDYGKEGEGRKTVERRVRGIEGLKEQKNSFMIFFLFCLIASFIVFKLLKFFTVI